MHTIGQVLAENQSVLLTYGPMGIVLAWFMWRGEKYAANLADLAHRIDGLTKALLVDMAERESTGSRTKQYARDAIAKIEARDKKTSSE